MSVSDGFINTMAAAPTDTSTAISGDVVVPRRRGKSKAPNFKYEGQVSVIRLELDVSGEQKLRRRLQRQWEAAFRLRRALQRDANVVARIGPLTMNARCRSERAARAAGTVPQRNRGGGQGPYRGRSGWMRDHLTKAVGLHVADEVWETVDRHLFTDSSDSAVHHGPRRGGISPAFPAVRVPTPNPHRRVRPTVCPSPCMCILSATGTHSGPPR